MITVACSGCGASFHARDEHAGRRGRCPQCGAAVLVPAVAAAAAAPSAPHAAAPGPATAPSHGPHPAPGRPAHAGPRPHGHRARGLHARELSSGPPVWLLPSIALVILFGVVAWFAMGQGGPDAVKLIQDGIDAGNQGDYAAAIAAFEQVPRDSSLYRDAQQRLTEAREQQEAVSTTRTQLEADVLAAKIESLRRDWVEKPGPAAPRYAAQTRYLLGRAREFTERFPDDPRAADMRALAVYYRNVASLDRPPTALDARVEIEWRAADRQYAAATAVIDELAAAPGADPGEVGDLREALLLMAESDWKNTKALLDRTLAFEPGNENWKQIHSRTSSYLAAIGTLEVGAEARELFARASAALGLPGG